MMTNLLFNQLTAIGKRFAMVLTMLLMLGVTQAWGAEATVSWTATSGALGSGIGNGTIKTGSFTWNYNRTKISGESSTGYNDSSQGAIRLGKNGGVENITFTTSDIPGMIKSIIVECASYQGKHNLSINVGGNAYYSNAVPAWGSGQIGTVSSSGNSSGIITISFTNGSRALYIKSISVTYEENSGGGEPTPEPDDDTEDACGWVEADISEITSTDNVVITMSKGDKVWALANNKGTGSAPTALLITIANGEITPAEDGFNYNGYSLDYYTWNISTNSDALTFYPKESTSTWLYCNNSNDGVRVGTNTNKTFQIDGNYLKHNGTSRYVGVYINNPDWRCYTNTTGNIVDQTLKFYKYVECGSTQPTGYTITYNTNGGDEIAAISGTALPNPLPTPTREHYTFVDWYTDESCTQPATAGTTIDADITLYAKWEAILYTVTLNPNYPAGKTGVFKDKEGNTIAGNIEVPLQSGTASQALTNFYSSIELDNYAFDGFYTQAEGGSKRVNTGDITGNITFYAHWKEKYTITWNVNGDTELISPTTFAEGDAWDMPTTDYDCSGKKFVGWTTNPIIAAQDEAPDPLYTNASQFPNATATYYAVFAENTGGGGGEVTYTKVTTISEGTYLMATITEDNWLTKSTLAYTGDNGTGKRGGVIAVTISNNIITTKPASAKEITVQLGTGNNAGYFSMYDGTSYITQTTKNEFNFANSISYDWSLNANGQIKQKDIYDNKDDIRIYMSNGNSGQQTEHFQPLAAKTEGNNNGTYYYHAYLFKKSSISSETTYSGYITNCTQVPDPTWVPATISHSTIKVVCGSTTSPSATGTNGPATIIFDGSNLVNSVTVTASTGFLVSTNKTDANTYKQTITINPIASGDHEGTLDNIYIIASTSKETSEDYAGTITLEGEDITDGSQEISVTADVTCLPYTLTFNDRGSTIPATYYAGALVPEPTPPTDVCTDPINYEFDGWAMAIVEDGSVEYTKVDFSTFTMPANNNTILYAVYRYAEESTDDVCDENQFKIVRTQNELESGADYILAGYNGTYDYAMTKTIRKYTNSYYDVLTSIKNSEYINDDYIITLDNDEEEDFVWKITGDLTNGYQIYDEYSNKYLTLGEWYLKNTSPREYFTRFDWEDTGTKFRININEEKNGAAYISYTNNYTWYFGLMYYIDEPDQHIIRGTTTETYIYLYKRCSGIKYLYTTTPDCDSDCTPATDITYTTEGTSITLSWTATEPSAKIILYADKNATSPVKEINNATSPYTINGLAETTTYYAQIVTNEDCTSAITEVSTERPYVEIVEWDTDHLNAYINTNEDITITLENEVQKGTPTSRVATELFFSKYFEATGNVKLLALYNGTEKAIDLTSYKIKLSVLGASSLTDKNESTDIDYAQTINLGTDIPAEKRTLPAGKELILIAYANSGADDAVIFMNPDGTQSEIDKNDAAILTCAANSTTSGWNEYIRISTGKLNFSGNDAVALFKDETLIDIIGAGDATDADVRNLSPKTDFMDNPGWYNTEGYQIQPDGTIGATKNYALSTNRCLLIRRNSVTSGNDAVTKNKTNFATLGGENCEWMGYQIPDKASACEGFEYVGGYDFSSYYSSYEELSSNYYSPATRNSDGTYTVNVNLTPHACKRLMITIKNHTTQQVMAVQEYKVPIIIDTDHTTTGKKFTDLKNNLGTIIVDQNGTPTGDITPLTDEEWKAACKECDVVVRDKATLSHESGGINQFRDMTIYPTGKLDNGNSQAITLNSLQMQSMNNEIPYAIINNDGSTIDVGNMVFIKRMDDKYWYQFSLPYDCNISDIRQLNGQSMGKYWVDWGIKEYNGKRRQTEGTAATEGQVSQYWEKVEENATLKAHQGYIIGLFTHKWATVYFTPSTTNPYRESGNDAKTTTVKSWYTTNLATLAPRHHGWNFTGSPYITQFGQANAGQGMNNTLLMKGEINQESIDQEYINTENVYVTIPDLPDGLTYTQAIASTTTIKPFTAYFVQTIDVTGYSDETTTLTYDKTGRSLPSSAPARAAATKQRVLVELNITAPDGQTDNTGIWVDERYTTDYEIAADLTKMYVAGTKPQLYTIAVDNEKLAYNALPDNAAAYIPLGLYAPVAGDYTLTLDERVSRVAGAETVELLYNNQLVANLLYQDYTITANKGTVSGYSLSIRRRADVSTAVDNTTGSTITLIANDEYISLVGVPTDATISIYDMLGRLISSQQANGQSVVNMPIVPQGVYNIVVANGTGYTTIKSVIK